MSDLLPDSFDVLIVGGGAAGLYAALCLPSHFQIGLITKDTLSLSASDWAQGGIAAAIAPDDSPTLHIEDTLRAGAGLCEPEAVALLVEKAPACVRSLVSMGVGFDRQGNGLALTLEAAHSRRRVLHAADTTGRAMVSTLTAQVLSRKNIRVIPQSFALDLGMEAGYCQGIRLLHQNQIIGLRAGAVLLATGGGGQVFAQTTNPALSTGDGVAMAWRGGAEVRDLEFMQFHPTALTKPGAPRFLISEAVRGEGAHLIDAVGDRFAFEYHPAGELAPRDVVSRAIFSHLQKTTADPAAHVWLDLRPIAPETVRHRFPNIIQVCQHWGIDVFQAPIPVAPAAHYWMGGITTDTLCRTSIPGLYAIGETASTGVHGANRLASNSLLECLVFGAQLATLELPGWQNKKIPPLVSRPANIPLSGWQEQASQIQHWRQEVPRLMWQSAGICREQVSLTAAIAQVQLWQQEFTALPISQFLQLGRTGQPFGQSFDLSEELSSQVRSWAETRNLLDIAALILKSAAFRQESRGGHYRLDYPLTDPAWQLHTIVEADLWQKSRPVPSTPT
ncbi:MAG: L-aspartate oxidase [Leptolyngbyaceae cyanobacterium CRU_2_3]|nr:L-aspartate oxidase [Leptolyngbyaceae cyanobacterium CRU_2_3]